MMHPDTELKFINDEMGYGVVAKKFIPKGTITWVQDELDQIFSPEQVENMHPGTRRQVDKYSFRNNNGNFVLCWDLAKYVNHSFKANCLSSAYDFELAVRDINAGEQLTDDYGYLNITEPFKASNEGTPRDTVYPDDLLKFHKEWDAQLAEAFKVFDLLEQPLLKYVEKQTLFSIRNRLKENLPQESILNLYYREKN